MKINFSKYFSFLALTLLVEIFFVEPSFAQTITNDGLGITVTSGMTITISGHFLNQNSGTISNSGVIETSGNWTNNSTGNVFSSNSGRVKFNGSGAQTIGGTAATTFYAFALNNSTGAILNTNMQVSDSLIMTAGNFNLANYTLTLGTSTSTPGYLNYSSGWMYGGTIKRWFNNSAVPDSAIAGLFPIGSATDYRPVYLSSPSVAPTTGGTFSVSHVSNPSVSAVSWTDDNITIDRHFDSYWSISSGNGISGGTYNLRIDGTGFPSIPLLSTLRITQASSGVGNWGINRGILSSPKVSRNNIALAQLNNNFYFSYPSSTLPIELISFDAVYSENEVLVTWQTSAEINNDYFSVERSLNGTDFQTINTTKGAGNTTIVNNYSFIDKNPFHGTSYYRLKQTDFDGHSKDFTIVAVTISTNINDKTAIEIFPNIFNDFFNARIDLPEQQEVEMQLINMNGELSYSKKITAARGNNIYRFNTSENFPPGVYMLRLINEKQILASVKIISAGSE